MAGSALRTWGSMVAGAVDQVGAAVRITPPALDDASRLLRPVSSASLRGAGWELRNAFVWRNDNFCVQRAAFGALSLGERIDGGIAHTVRGIAAGDAAAAGMAVAYGPTRFPGGARMHAATVARTFDDELLVIDHLVSGADDGVMPLAEWMQRIGAKAERTTILPALHEPTLSLGSRSGIPQSSRRWDGAGWNALAGHLAGSWDDAARARLSLAQRVGAG